MHWLYIIFLVSYAGYCVYAIYYVGARQTKGGEWALTAPAGFTWILQLLGIIFVYWKHWKSSEPALVGTRFIARLRADSPHSLEKWYHEAPFSLAVTESSTQNAFFQRVSG